VSRANPERTATLQRLEEEAEAHYVELLVKRDAGDLFYIPRPSSLYVWELEVCHVSLGIGRRGAHRFARLFATRGFAAAAACYEILRYYSEGPVFKKERDAVTAALAEERQESFLEEWSATHGALQFNIRRVEIQGSPEPYETVAAVEKKGKVHGQE
jgi:hypothetical protein